MRKNKFILLISLIFISGCSGSQGKWEEIIPKGISGQNVSLNYLFLNGPRAIFLGTNASDGDVINKRFEKSKAMVFSSLDNCHNWITQQIGNGDFTSATSNGNIVCTALNLRRYGSVMEPNLDSTSIYYSDDFGAHWLKISSFSKLYVRDIYCLSDRKMYLIAKKTGSAVWNLLHTINRGVNWDVVQSFSDEIKSPVILHNNLFYLSKGDIIRYSLKYGRRQDKISLHNSDFDAHFLSAENDELYVAGIDRKIKCVQVTKIAISSPYQLENVLRITSEKFPISFHVTDNNSKILLLGERNPLGATFSIYKKNNDGKETTLPMPSATIEPYRFSDNSLYTYSYSGMINCLRID